MVQDKERELLKEHAPAAIDRLMTVFWSEVKTFESIAQSKLDRGAANALVVSFMVSMFNSLFINACTMIMKVGEEKSRTWHVCIMLPLIKTLHELAKRFDVDIDWKPKEGTELEEIEYVAGED